VPLQNRVLPTQEIVSDSSRGLLMGNRGCLHGQGRELGVSRWRSKLWIACVLDWRGRRRDPMPPGRWTALFFLDEATALAAGHRPCAYCRRADYLDFNEAWQAGRLLARGDDPPGPSAGSRLLARGTTPLDPPRVPGGRLRLRSMPGCTPSGSTGCAASAPTSGPPLSCRTG
jgi:hypothetical protein